MAKKTSTSRVARVLSSKLVFRGPVFKVFNEQVREPAGYIARRDVIRHPGSVVVLAVQESSRGKSVLLERQYRHAAAAYLWELPAGKIDPKENALHAGKRELLEETGYTAKRWKPILDFYVSPGFLDERMKVFLARDLKKGTAQPEDDEAIECRFFSLSAALKMVRSEVICDAKTIAALYWLALQH